MGIYSRDYLREDNVRGGGGSGAWRDFDAIKWIIIVNVAVFILQVVWQHDVTRELAGEVFTIREPMINSWLVLDRSAIFGGQIWRLLTYEFLHNHLDQWHLFFNMLGLFFAGRKVEAYYGPREFLFFYLGAGIISGLFTVMWYSVMGPAGWEAVGASGAVAAVFIVYALHWPFDVWRIFFFLPVQAMWLAIIYAVADIYPMLAQIGGGSQFYDGVAHSAHVGGMLFALIYQRRDWRVSSLLDRVKIADVRRAIKPKAKLRVFEPEIPVDPEARLDELLAKVAEHGESSLSESERAELVAFSRRFKNRQR